MGFLKSAFVVSFFTLLARFFGFIRDIFFAKYLGSGMLADIFLTAFKLPNFFRNIFAEGAFNSAFIPIFSSELAKNCDDRDINQTNIIYFSRNIFSMLLYSLLIFTLIIEIFMPTVINMIASGFNKIPEKFELTVSLSRITFFYLIFISLVSFMSGILNSMNKFAAVSVCPIILNITFIIFSIASSYFSINIARLLSYAVVVGGILQFFWLLIFTIKEKVILYPVYPKIDSLTKNFFKNFFNGVLSSGIIQINSIVDSIMAARIAGAISFIYYADRISQLPLALIGTAISISILPVLSKKISLEDNNVLETQNDSLFVGLLLGLPCMVGLYFFSDIAVPLLFERGAFTKTDSLAVVSCLKIYAFALPAFIVIKILQTIFFANKDTKTPMKASFVSLLINIILNIMLIKFFSYRGIILSTVLASFANVFILVFMLIKQKKINFTEIFILKILKIVYSLIFMIIFIFLLRKFISVNCEDIFLLKLVKLCLVCGLPLLLYFVVSIMVGLIDINGVKKLLKNKKSL